MFIMKWLSGVSDGACILFYTVPLPVPVGLHVVWALGRWSTYNTMLGSQIKEPGNQRTCRKTIDCLKCKPNLRTPFTRLQQVIEEETGRKEELCRQSGEELWLHLVVRCENYEG